MACWHRDLSLPQMAHIDCYLQGPYCGAVRIDPYRVLQRLHRKFRAHEDLIRRTL